MANDLGSLSVFLKANTLGLQQGIKQAEGMIDRFDKALKVVGLGVSFAAVKKLFAEVADHSSEARDAMNRFSRDYGDSLGKLGPITASFTAEAGFALRKLGEGWDWLSEKAAEGLNKIRVKLHGSGAEIADWSKGIQDILNGDAPGTLDFGAGAGSAPAQGADTFTGLQASLDKKSGPQKLDFAPIAESIGAAVADAMGTIGDEAAQAVLEGIATAPDMGGGKTKYGDAARANKMTVEDQLAHQGQLNSLTSDAQASRRTAEAGAAGGNGILADTVNATTSAFEGIIGKLGDFGSVAKDTVSLFSGSATSPTDVIANVAVTIAQHAASFKDLMAVGAHIMETLGKALNPFVEAMIPLIELFGGLADLFLSALSPAIEGLSWVIEKVIGGIAWVINAIIEGLAKFVGIFSDSLADKLRKHKINVDKWDTGETSVNDKLDMFGKTIDDTTKKVDDYNSGITNGPKGFKYEQTRYDATLRGGGAAAAGPVTNIGTVNVEANNVDELLAKMAKIARQQLFHQTGTTTAPSTGRAVTVSSGGSSSSSAGQRGTLQR